MRYEEKKGILEIIPADYQFNLSDFALFLSVMKNKKAYEDVLSIILEEEDIALKEVKAEQVVLNRSGKRAIRLDAWAIDFENRQFNTEMQNDTGHDDVRKRARFYQGMLDTPLLKSGKQTRYRNLPSTVIIFITQEDIFKRDKAKYTFSEQCEEIPGLKLEDGTKKLFLNMTSKCGRPELISLLQYMKNTTLDNPEIIVKDRRIVELDNIVTEVKQSEEWEAVKMNILEIGMAKGREEGLEKGREEGREEGIQEGVLQGTQEGIFLTLAGLVKDGLLSVEEASKRVQVTVEEFEKRMQEEDNV
ncbi:MAG: Rpn family recombination-promoting nuclease/putative transposase [Lachnospiraceae bacterium]|nr:Rpn family recombination-promoting nuclease/putative transposase [Lachnospiraceae bacterium]